METWDWAGNMCDITCNLGVQLEFLIIGINRNIHGNREYGIHGYIWLLIGFHRPHTLGYGSPIIKVELHPQEPSSSIKFWKTQCHEPSILDGLYHPIYVFFWVGDGMAILGMFLFLRLTTWMNLKPIMGLVVQACEVRDFGATTRLTRWFLVHVSPSPSNPINQLVPMEVSWHGASLESSSY